ncbi:MAG TPA: DUF1684 domain-containing protein [Candidatus Thermoplasmatota archaeon]|nr:DUF1684 domain-containing protein [Candidatus Thermoplasmatota archaeon]
MPWPASVEEERRWREAAYLGPDTPLSPDRRAEFKGLQWFPVDARFRLPGARLRRHAMARPAALASTGDDAVRMEEVGVFEFALLGTPCRLLAFEPAPGEADERYILIPFRDATTGKETYGAGRYLDLEPTPDDVYDLDFNRAYHPYCAHDDAWSCTLPPPENRLPVRVEAGERL